MIDVVAPSPLSLLPVAVTLALALTTRNVILGLFAGVVTGVAQLTTRPLWELAPTVIGEHLVPQVTDGYNAGVLVLLVFIGGFVALVERSGAAGAFARSFARRLVGPVRTQLGAWASGIAIFFSDLGTPLIVGPVFRPLAARAGISRQKLALILDATASPVAILVPFIGWGVYVMGLLRSTFDGRTAASMAGLPAFDEYAVFVSAIAFQSYAWLAITTIPLLALTGRDWGPMARVEAVSARGDAETGGTSEPTPAADAAALDDHPNARPSLVWLPLLVMALSLVVLLGPKGFPFEAVPGSEFRAALASAYLLAALTLVLLSTLQRVRGPMACLAIYLDGTRSIMSIAITLVLAWTLADVGDALGAPAFVSSVLADRLPPWLLPLCVFATGALLSFATGSSWGTFAILIPLAVPTALMLGAPLSVTVAAVLSGGLFGDHASPLSETTILSATGAGTPQFEHFRTQMPYALANGAVAALALAIAGAWPSPVVTLAAIAVQFFVFRALASGPASALARIARSADNPPQEPAQRGAASPAVAAAKNEGEDP